MIDSCHRHHSLPANSHAQFDSLQFDTEFPSLESREYNHQTNNPCALFKSAKKRKSDFTSHTSPEKKAKTQPLKDDHVSRSWGEHHVSRPWREDSQRGSEPLQDSHVSRPWREDSQRGSDSDEEEEEGEGEHDTTNLRISLKIVRDPTKTAYDLLPSGETIGAFANKHALARYARKIENKRERAREIRKKKKKIAKRDN